MANSWQVVPISEITIPAERSEKPIAGKIYRQIGVRLWGEGAYERESIDGSNTQYAFFSRVEKDDIVVNKIWARNGSVAVVPEKLAGCFVSSEFPIFTPLRDRLAPRWFHWITKTRDFWNQCDEKSRGTSGKNRIRPEQFLKIEIPLPPLAEQQRIVARVDELARRVEEARGLRRAAMVETEAIVHRASSFILDEQNWKIENLEDVIAESPRNGLAPQQKAEQGGRRMLRINAVSSSPTRIVDMNACKLVDVADKVAQPFVLQNDDVFIVRYNGDINRVAKAAIFKSDQESDMVYPDKLIRLRANKEKVSPDYLVFALGSQRVRAQIEELGKTTAGQIGISGADAKSFQIPVPPLADQHRIVAYLDGLQAKVDELRRLQAATQKELDALMPSILAKAFAGEL
ncbi:MAG: restriction endonuclease subunit S [Chloroflexi bacterium]|nr:restriction endonuclease subunit S [Chloroflexota bacterium]